RDLSHFYDYFSVSLSAIKYLIEMTHFTVEITVFEICLLSPACSHECDFCSDQGSRGHWQFQRIRSFDKNIRMPRWHLSGFRYRPVSVLSALLDSSSHLTTFMKFTHTFFMIPKITILTSDPIAFQNRT
ncbi:hypothetical protein L9F63_012214, partial [Diploptera punctata]